VRETLFNWLAAHVRGARVLDLFAGSGALGLESLSRGAAYAKFIDTDLRAITALRERFVEWRVPADAAEAVRVDATALAAAKPAAGEAPYDIIFLDPPFAASLWQTMAERLDRNGWLAPKAFIYIEAPVRQPMESLPQHWVRWRDGAAGEVGYYLFRTGDT